MKIRYLVMTSLSVMTICLFCPVAWSAQEILSSQVNNTPIIDGSNKDTTWDSARAYTIHDARMNSDIILKSVHTNDMIFFLVRYPDNTEDRLHKPWRWDKELDLYKIGPEREDTFQFRWSMESKEIDLSSFSDDNFHCDIWYWKANRTDMSGYADDKHHFLSTSRELKSNQITSRSGATRYLKRMPDEGAPAYKKHIYIHYTKDLINQYDLMTPSGSRADVKAKGIWMDGFWTIEFARKLRTNHSDDVMFDHNSKKRYQFGISIKSLYGEPIDNNQPNLYGQGRISEKLFLIFR